MNLAAVLLPFLKRPPAAKRKEAAAVDDRGWSRIFDFTPGAYQTHHPYDTETSVLAHPTVFACISLISSDIGKLRPTIEATKNKIWEQVTGHPLEALLLSPNNYQNHIQFKERWTLSKLIHGNTYALKDRDMAGRIVGLHILDPLKVTPLVADNGDVYYKISNDKLSQVEQQITLPASEIIHDRINCYYHPLVGLSPIFACGTTSTMGLKIITNSKALFENGSNPGGVLTAPGSISDSTAKRLKEYFEEHYKGEKTGGTAVLGDGLKFETMRMSSVDAQLLEQLNWSAEAICACFHVPAYMVGVGAAPAHNNVEALTLQYYAQCLQTHIEGMEEAQARGLALEARHRVQLALTGLFRMDQSTLIRSLKEAREAGLMAPDEGRRALNLPPVPGGEYPYLQQQNYSLAALAERDKSNPLAVPPAPAPPPPPPEPTDDEIAEQANYLAFWVEKECSALEH